MRILITSAALILLTVLTAFAQQPPLLTIQSVTDSYIQNNLELQAARFKVERARAGQIAAKLRPNPGINITAENFVVSGPAPFSRLYEIGTTYTEIIELGGKRQLREKAAGSAVTAAEAQFEDTIRRGVAEVKKSFLDALLARYYVDIATENRRTFEQLVQFNQTRFQEGAIAEVELIKVRLERVKFESSFKQAQLNLQQAKIRLMEKLGASAGGTGEIGGALTFAPMNLDPSSLRKLALEDRSDVRAALAEIDAANDRLAVERGRSKTDLSPFAGYKRLGNDNTVLFGVNIPLKVRDHNEGEIARAQADVKAAEVHLKIIQNRALADVDAAYGALQTQREMVEVFEKELLQQADESRSITLAAYEEGGTELLPVLEAQRTRTEVQQQYFKTLFDYQASIVALELAVGREIQP